jgi:hypothetical protein
VRVFALCTLVAVVPPLSLRRRWSASGRWPWGRRRRPEQAPAEQSLERLVADLRRLEQDFRRTERSDSPYQAARLQALTLAYDDTLRRCCALLEVPAPDRPPWSPFVRLEVEAALAQAGLDW